MKLWALIPLTDKKYTEVVPTDEFYENEELQKYWHYEIGERPAGENYKPIEVRKKYRSKKLWNISCFFDRVQIIDEKAKKALGPILKKCNAEILPLICKDADLYAVNILDRFTPEEVLDMGKSNFIRFKSSGKIMFITKFCFKGSAVEGKHLFDVNGNHICDDEFKNAVESNGLTGLEFKLVYQSAEE